MLGKGHDRTFVPFLGQKTAHDIQKHSRPNAGSLHGNLRGIHNLATGHSLNVQMPHNPQAQRCKPRTLQTKGRWARRPEITFLSIISYSCQGNKSCTIILPNKKKKEAIFTIAAFISGQK